MSDSKPTWEVITGDCLEVLPTLAAGSIDAVITDPPYFRVKDDDWDRQWKHRESFLEWLDRVLVECARVLKTNGSLYLFASPQMAARVELAVDKHLSVLNRITWMKESSQGKNSGNWRRANKESLRRFFPQTEAIIFAEQRYQHDHAANEPLRAYHLATDRLLGEIMRPVWGYIESERQRAGVSKREIETAAAARGWPKYVMTRHYFGPSQFECPTEENYQRLRVILSALDSNGKYLRREYEDLRREYEDLRREYEDLRRPFNVSANIPYTDVWRFVTVPGSIANKHPAQKPVDLLEHMIEVSTRPGATVLDMFAGSGTTGIACLNTGRNFIGIEQAEVWASHARARIAKAAEQARQLELL